MTDQIVYFSLTSYGVNYIKSPFYIKGKNNGVGNMLFQIATGLYFAFKNNAILSVPSLNTYFQLENLRKEDTIFRRVHTDHSEDYNEKKTIYVSYNRDAYFHHTFTNKMILCGYFEHYKNFDEYKETILDYFRPTSKDVDYLLQTYPVLTSNTLSSIHVRKGPDILLSKERFDEIKTCYFEMMDYMILNKNVNSFFVLTNDKEYCQEIFDNNEKYIGNHFFYSNERDFYDIWIISLIKNNIVSMSTLGWWGSYLNEHPDKFILSHKKLNGVYYPEWTYL